MKALPWCKIGATPTAAAVGSPTCPRTNNASSSPTARGKGSPSPLRSPEHGRYATSRASELQRTIVNTQSQGFENLLRQSLARADSLPREVKEGRFDLVAPDGSVILSTIWDYSVRPGWSVTIRLWGPRGHDERRQAEDDERRRAEDDAQLSRLKERFQRVTKQAELPKTKAESEPRQGAVRFQVEERPHSPEDIRINTRRRDWPRRRSSSWWREAESSSDDSRSHARFRTRREDRQRLDAEVTRRRQATAEHDTLDQRTRPTRETNPPIRFTDAVGRRFSFPFRLACTWPVSSLSLLVAAPLLLTYP